MRAALALALVLLAPATAPAATVTGGTDGVRFAAAPGEANDVLVRAEGSVATIVDAGAPLTAVAPCAAVDAHTVRCDDRYGLPQLDLGDGDDVLQVEGAVPTTATGGPGDDRLVGGAEGDALAGGGGTDVLLGGGGWDELTDGDGDAGAGPDELDGGPGRDTLSYAGRQAPVFVTLGDGEGTGAPGEGDAITAVEDLEGGAGDDVLIAGGPRTVSGYAFGLDGGPGDDRLVGSERSDRLVGGGGNDAFACGGGNDLVVGAARDELIGGGCESAAWSFGLRSAQVVAPYPRAVRGGRAEFRIECPSDDLSQGEPVFCRGALTLREASGARRRLGRGRIADDGGKGRFAVRVTFTPLGRRLAARPRGVLAVAGLRGRDIPLRAWTIRLRAG